MKKSAFIGPLPPPIGGVAVINQGFQNINYNGYKIISFDTSAKRDRENLYSNFKLNSIPRGLQVSKKILQFIEKEQPDVINVFVTSGMSILRDLLVLKNLSEYNIPIIVHFHSKTKGEFALTPKRLKWVAKFFNRYATRIILLSEYHYSFFTNYFYREKCVVVENFVRYSDFENNIEDKNKDFLFVGRLSKEKGFFDLLNAVKILKEKNISCRIQVIGLAPNEKIEAKIYQFVNRNKIIDYFVFNGATLGEFKHTIFKQTCCLLFPSHFENSPVVLKEAIAAKMAILSSDIEANQNILQNRKNYLSFNTGNVEDLAQKISALIAQPELVKNMCYVSANIKYYDVAFAKQKVQTLFNKLTVCNQ